MGKGRRLRLLVAIAAPLVLRLTACTATVTESQIEAREDRDDAVAAKEEKRDQRIGQEGGDNGQEVDEESGWANRESDL